MACTAAPPSTDDMCKVEDRSRRVRSDQHTFPFLKLPAELRRIVYEFVHDPTRADGLPTGRFILESSPFRWNLNPQLLRVCKEIHEEAAPIFNCAARSLPLAIIEWNAEPLENSLTMERTDNSNTSDAGQDGHRDQSARAIWPGRALTRRVSGPNTSVGIRFIPPTDPNEEWEPSYFVIHLEDLRDFIVKLATHKVNSHYITQDFTCIAVLDQSNLDESNRETELKYFWSLLSVLCHLSKITIFRHRANGLSRNSQRRRHLTHDDVRFVIKDILYTSQSWRKKDKYVGSAYAYWCRYLLEQFKTIISPWMDEDNTLRPSFLYGDQSNGMDYALLRLYIASRLVIYYARQDMWLKGLRVAEIAVQELKDIASIDPSTYSKGPRMTEMDWIADTIKKLLEGVGEDFQAEYLHDIGVIYTHYSNFLLQNIEHGVRLPDTKKRHQRCQAFIGNKFGSALTHYASLAAKFGTRT